MLSDVHLITYAPPQSHSSGVSGAARADRQQPDGVATFPGDSNAFRTHSQKNCCNGSLVGCTSDRSKVVIVPLTCKSWECPRCGEAKKQRTVRAFIAGKPTREIVLTCPVIKSTNPYNTAHNMKRAWRSLVAMIRRRFNSFEYALTWELTKKNIPHIHILYRGAYIPKKWIGYRWEKLGFGKVCYIKAIKDTRLSALHLAKYLVKHAARSAAAFAPLHIIQFSQKYLPPDFEPHEAAHDPDMTWIFTRDDTRDIIQRFIHSDRYLSSSHNNDYSLTFFMEPSYCRKRHRDDEGHWILYPDPPPYALGEPQSEYVRTQFAKLKALP